MIQNPILKVLFTFRKFGVKSLLIGGQACIVYGAAEFSRDTDFVVFCDPGNLNKLNKALNFLGARNIYVPPLKGEFLERGHACHFRCSAKPVRNLRIDIISKLKGCDDFSELWRRRSRIKIQPSGIIEVIGLEDLVLSKKTQRNKDWLMLDRLVENDIYKTKNPTKEKIKWWLCECRDPSRLVELAGKNKNLAKGCSAIRPLLKSALAGNTKKLNEILKKEEILERKNDERYWKPLINELEFMRHHLRT